MKQRDETMGKRKRDNEIKPWENNKDCTSKVRKKNERRKVQKGRALARGKASMKTEL
jgi:hypothetical protein